MLITYMYVIQSAYLGLHVPILNLSRTKPIVLERQKERLKARRRDIVATYRRRSSHST